MKQDTVKERLLRSTVVVGMAIALAFPANMALAQDDGTTPEESIAPIGAAVDDADDAASSGDSDDVIVVTGSRVRRDSFTSTAPLQVIDAETIAEAGLVDVGEILRSTTVVQGVQLDQQLNSSFVSDAGPGGQSVGLRGFDPSRTLVLVNGRRYAPAGVEGAPSYPDISLIPSSMIQRIDILLDGASSVYGSDAVAGVINVILKDEFQGLQLDAYTSMGQEEGGEESRFSFVLGDEGDRGSFVFGGEYVWQEPQYACDRDWMKVRRELDTHTGDRGCHAVDIVNNDNGTPGDPSDDYVEWTSGTTTFFQSFNAYPANGADPGAIILGRPGTAMPWLGIPNFERADLGANFDGLYEQSILQTEHEMYTPEFERSSFYFKGDYDLSEVLDGTSAFMEFNFSNRQTRWIDNQEIMDVVGVPGNPFDLFGATQGYTSRPMQPWRDTLSVELDQYRFITGIEGDLGFVGDAASGWDYELFAGYTRSQGFSSRTVVREEALIRSLQVEYDPITDSNVCSDVPNPTGAFSPGESLEPCIPFNYLYEGLWVIDGSAPTPEDDRIIDYLRGVRNVTTFVDELIFGGYATGPVFELPAGDLQTVIGFEWREDAIDTQSDDSAARGLGSGFFSDRPSKGSVNLMELYAEAVIPIAKGRPGMEDLELELAGRYTDHEYYGRNNTYSVKLRYAPTDYLTFRGTAGTSFRAPNLRELFLEGQSGFENVVDPCEVPTIAQSDVNPPDGVLDTYVPGLDTRSATVMANCVLEGLDPESLAIGIATGSVETFSAGNTGLDPETSFAYSAGFVLEQPWWDSFDLRVGISYFNVTVEDAVLSPTAQFLVSTCYASDDFLNDPFCTRRLRDPNTGFLLEVDATPFNIAEDVTSGYDLNIYFAKDFEAFGKDFTLMSDFVSTYSEEISNLVILDGVEDFDDDAGEIGNPEWRATLNTRLLYNDWTFFWRARYIGQQTAVGSAIPDNCLGPDTATGTADRTVNRCFTVPDIYYHDLSVNYEYDTWVIRVGINNIMDQDPPRIDEDVTATMDRRQVPIGVGYDRVGRSVFLNLTKSF